MIGRQLDLDVRQASVLSHQNRRLAGLALEKHLPRRRSANNDIKAADARHKGIGSYLDLGTARGAFGFAAPTERKRLGGARCRRKSANSGRALKLLTFLVGQCHDDRIFIDAKELGRVVVGIAED
jgi:hypothetical protein